ncbi:SGNH/GDSL hydrolase family protein [Breoghania sp. L-A4]|uniref:SGNH/GDSL hydrolase family protein n=1 Tax=Breoghania sp. L-A4 TaxID=2304600 RepID=UPI000E35ACB9|nr:SGNH/GDSL hydrolase family protein [Breoghania sp. L-A4]AXS39635.1 SGNH/GDSL hydrolase family protein [Breoghania sp. L-A4]
MRGPAEGGRFARLAAMASWLAFPVYAVQGIGVRLRTPRLLPARGALSGRFAGAGAEIRLLVVGESSAAAVGIARMEDGVAARVALELNRASGRPVFYRAAGFNGATAEQLRDHVAPHLEDGGWTHVLITVGVNDTKNFNSARRWSKGFGGLLFALRARFPEAAIYWTQILRMTEVPALPRPIADILEIRAQMVNRIAGGLCPERGAMVIPRMIGLTPEDFAPDGFHPSEKGFAGWAAHIAAHMDTDPAA